MKSNKGLFISFEGLEASGKSSQILLLSKYFKKNHIPFIISREPGGTDFAEKLRKLILDNKSSINNLEELLLLMAARSNHINEVIVPNLKKGKIHQRKTVVSNSINNHEINDKRTPNQALINSDGLNEFHKKILFIILLPVILIYLSQL